MPAVKTDAIVLRYANYGEYDRMLTLLSPELGKLSVSAKGCRRGRSKTLNATELFCAGEYMLNQKLDRYSLTGTLIKDSYYDLRTDYERLEEGVYWLRASETIAQPAQEQRLLFALLLRGLAYLCYSKLDIRMIGLAFYTHLASVNGFAPELDRCAACGGELRDALRFDAGGGGVVCAACAGARSGMELNPRTLEVLRGFRGLKFAQLSGIETDAEALSDAYRTMRAYLDSLLER